MDQHHPASGYQTCQEQLEIYVNAEPAGSPPGHAQLFRLHADGSGMQQLTDDERVNWFPHLTPDGRWMLYLSYEPGTKGHPANRHVQLRLATPDGTGIRVVRELYGGQGTLNVNSWAPQGEQFAYVAYPLG